MINNIKLYQKFIFTKKFVLYRDSFGKENLKKLNLLYTW